MQRFGLADHQGILPPRLCGLHKDLWLKATLHQLHARNAETRKTVDKAPEENSSFLAAFSAGSQK
jgi:hypothetical protein